MIEVLGSVICVKNGYEQRREATERRVRTVRGVVEAARTKMRAWSWQHQCRKRLGQFRRLLALLRTGLGQRTARYYPASH